MLFSVYELDGVPSETTRFFRQLAEGLAIPQKKKYRKNIACKTNSSNIVGKCKDILRFKINSLWENNCLSGRNFYKVALVN